jgi:Flp pilus assembly protein TadG
MHRFRRKISHQLRHLAGDRGGNFALTTALLLVPLVAAAGGAIDYVDASLERTRLQDTLDAAILSAVSKPDPASQRDEAERFLANAVSSDTDLQSALIVTANPDGSLTGILASKVDTRFLSVVGIKSMDIKVRSTAIAVKAEQFSDTCIRVLGNQPTAVLINTGANVKSKKCAVEVASTQNPAFTMNSGATIATADFCVAGTNYLKNGGTLSNLKTGCNISPDPYAGKIPEPAVSATCTSSGVRNEPVVELAPGVHCGTTFHGTPVITFKPGLHIIKGRMILNTGTTVIAEGVTFYFPDTDSEIRANGGLSFTASAPTKGAYKGILMFEKTSDPANNARKQQYIFNGSLGENLSGVIYLPNRDVVYNSKTNQESKISLVVNTIIMNSSQWQIEPYEGIGGTSEIKAVRLVN